MGLSLLAVLQAGRHHAFYSEMMIDQIPLELADGRPVDVVASSLKPHNDTQGKNDKSGKGVFVEKSANVSTEQLKNTVISINDHVITRISNGNKTGVSPIPVVVWPYVEHGVSTAVSKHLEENGVEESGYLELSKDMWNFDQNVVWVGDLGVKSCDKFHKKIKQAKEKRAELGLALQWPVFIIDWTDYGKNMRCKSIEEDMGPEFVKYSQRSIVKGRKWRKEEGWVTFGERWKEDGLGTRRHMPYFVRTDTVESLDKILKEQYNMTLASPIEKLRRTIDVSHFWPLNMKGVRNIQCKLRKMVSKVVSETGKEANLTTFVELAGKAVKKGRTNVKSAYVEAMLDSKIIVVTQRDQWEDHYRLFEALTSGAMIMADRMLSLPHGLENGTSVVEFGSAEDLRSKILYYSSHPQERLEIARKGREVSMSRHRTWHRMEEIIFGRAISDCSNATSSESSCPYIVHASEAT